MKMIIQNMGKGFWKFNACFLLHDWECVTKKNKKIESMDTYKHIDDTSVTWELIQVNITYFTVPFCTKKKRNFIQLEKSLTDKFVEIPSIV